MSNAPVEPTAPDGFQVRLDIDVMTDREILEEILTHMRNVENALAGLADNPMIAALASGQNPLLAMMGR